MSLRLAMLVSGQGSNFAALLAACAEGRIDGEVVGVFSDKPDCGAVARARAAGVHTWAMRPNTIAGREAFDAAMFDAIEAVQPDLIVCAGYLRIIGPAAIERFPHRMINLHPSLLPRHPGLHTHARALAAGDAEHGASVHIVIPELDAGPVVAQADHGPGRINPHLAFTAVHAGRLDVVVVPGFRLTAGVPDEA